MKNGNLHRYTGFKSGDEIKISKFFKTTYNKDCLEKELSLKGQNSETVHFTGSVLSFDCDKKTSFEIPLQHVSQCTTGKNEVIIKFHQNDDAPLSLMEMRMHIPASESSEIQPVDAFYQNVMKQSSVISVSGDAIAIFREIQCLTPRGRYDIKIFQTFFQLHAKRSTTKFPCRRCCEWEQKANKHKKRYADEMEKFTESSASGVAKSSPAKRKHESPGTNKGCFTSKEYISDDDSNDSDNKGSKKKVAKVQEKNDKSSKSSKKSR
ncbi:hypothetical protein HA402_007131 [Bradysia odoriphaga]|nr:hypothetical protein HA402_007131 [Bradysia odoriphaga]